MGIKKIFISIKNELYKSIDIYKWLKKQGVKIGENCEIYRNVSFGSEPYLIEIGNHVRITSGVKLITHDGGVWVLRELKEEYKDIDIFGKIKIGNNVHIGIDSIIMPGVTIGNNVIIGCKSVITRDIPDNCVVVGIPGRPIKTVKDYEEKNKKRFVHTKLMNSKEKKLWIQSNYLSLKKKI